MKNELQAGAIPANEHRMTIGVMAVAAGVIVANIYYNQPILKAIGDSIGATEIETGKIPMFSQLGYGLGMFFLLPLGDKLKRKNLILFLTSLLTIFLLFLSFARSINAVYLFSFIIGLCSSPAQIILPMAATISTSNRGKMVGKVFAGILVGILGARVVAGLITDYWGWRTVFRVSAIMVLLVSALMLKYLPTVEAKFEGSYLKLLHSTVKLVGEYGVLRQAALLGSFTFGTFCSFWTTLTFHLGSAPFGYSSGTIGLFGIIAIGGALVAPYFGKLADKGQIYKSLVFTVSLIIVSIVLLKLFPYSVLALCIAIFILDIGVQATQITNFIRIYALHEHAHSRLNTIYMTTYFIGAAFGTFFGTMAWNYGHWSLATWQLLLWAFVALGIVFLSRKKLALSGQ
jgi:predicted MFS family arabinose efflux permease